MDRLRELEAHIKREFTNLVKSKHRPRTLGGIETKRQQLQAHFSEYRTLLKTFEFRIKSCRWNEEVELYSAIKLIYAQSIQILDNTVITDKECESDPDLPTVRQDLLKPNCEDSLLRANSDIQLAKRNFNFKVIVKLIIWCLRLKNINMTFSIKTAAELATLIPAFDGSPAGAKSFVDAVNLAKTVVPAESKAAAIQIILTKLSGKARNLFAATPAEYDDIITLIQNNCGEKGNSDLALANLKNLKPKSAEDLQNFTKQVDLLADKLSETYIREQIPNDVAKRLTQKAAIQTLINGTANKETKMMLKVGKFDNLQEAINVVIENDQAEKNSNAVVFHASRNFRQSSNHQAQGRYQNFHPQNSNNRNVSTNGRFQQRPNNQFRYQSRYPANYQRNPNNNQNFSRYQSNRNHGNNNNFGRYQDSARMYFANQQNIPQLNQFTNPSPPQGQPSVPNFSNVVASNNPVNHNQQLSLPPNNGNPNYFLARQ